VDMESNCLGNRVHFQPGSAKGSAKGDLRRKRPIDERTAFGAGTRVS